MTGDDDYDVGYGKPPKTGQFKPGQSGNPKGRPKGRKSLETTLEDVFRKKVTIREGGKTRKISLLEAMVRRVLNDSVKGDGKATDQALKLFSLLQSMGANGEGGQAVGAPDLASDLETISQFLKLHDLPTDGLREDHSDVQVG